MNPGLVCDCTVDFSVPDLCGSAVVILHDPHQARDF